MNTYQTSKFRRSVLGMCGALLLALPGCGSGNSNEREFMNAGPAAPPDEHAGESFADRRARTLRVPSQIKAVQDRASKKAKVGVDADAKAKTP